ncbi:MAG: glycosyltransferase [Mycoplasmataceae bacterium]|nr:glycosyltransferase [Mycoplasmataceae bacterium]
MKKISVLTPTYNDAKSIEETLMSLVEQTYTNWESIIIDDGSTDNTKHIIQNFKNKYDKDNKINYIYQENADQLNAILNGLSKVSGDYIFVLHSDDLLPSNNFFEKIVSEIEENNCDAIIGDLKIINNNSETVNRWKALKYRNSKSIPAILLLNQGGNIYGDVALWKKDVYTEKVKNNYLNWNTPFWIDLQNKPIILNVKTVNFPILKYRIHETNYINNDIGKFNVLNGELRALTILLNYYKIPLYNFQKFIWNFIRTKGIRKLSLSNYFVPFYFNRETKNKYRILKNKIQKTYGNSYKENVFLNSILEFYKNNSDRIIELENLKSEEIFMGKDIRIFTKKLFDNNLPKFYYNIFEEMQKGFRTIKVQNEAEKLLAINIAKFLCIYPYVKIVIK